MANARPGRPVPPPKPARGRAARARRVEEAWQDDADIAEPTAAQDQANAIERTRRAARRTVDAEEAERSAPEFARFSVSLRAELDIAVEDPGWAVEGMGRPGHIATLPSPRKTGKTTFLGNLAWSGVDEEPFLGRFGCALAGNVCAVNAEMTKDDYLWTYRRLGIQHDDRIFMIHCLDEGIRVNLLSDITCERFIKWLRARDAEWLFLDPWKNLMSWAGADLNDNRGANDLLVRIQQVRSEAGLGLVVIPMNTTQAVQTAGNERAKGAGEVEDGADTLWRYSAVDGAADSPRFLSCRGRGGVSMGDLIVEWDSGSEWLTAKDGNRADALAARNASAAAEALALGLINLKADKMNAGDFDKLLTGDDGARHAARKAAVAAGLVVETPGKGNAKWYSMPE